MFFRPRAQLQFSPRQHRREDERLLPYIELQDYPISANSDASPESETSVLKGDLQTIPQEHSPRNRLQKLAHSLKLSSYVEILPRRLQLHSPRDQWIVLQECEQLDCCDRVATSPEKGHRRGRFWKAKFDCEAETSWRSAVDWYFCSPAETVKNCPTLEFLHVRLAPPSVWL